MSIAFLRAAHNSNGTFPNPTSPLVVTVTLNAGETGVLVFSSPGTGGNSSVSSITGGGTWVQRDSYVQGVTKTEIWTTASGGATSTTSVSISHTAVGNSCVGAIVGAYSGVGAIGGVAHSGDATGAPPNNTNPALSYTLTTPASYFVAGMGSERNETPSTFTGSLRDAFTLITSTSTDIAMALVDNTAALATSVTDKVTLGSSQWVMTGVELQQTTALQYATADADI